MENGEWGTVKAHNIALWFAVLTNSHFLFPISYFLFPVSAGWSCSSWSNSRTSGPSSR